jgi:hypothetical protein
MTYYLLNIIYNFGNITCFIFFLLEGAATYACSGSTCCPSIAAVCNRAGWTMGKVKDTYIQYEAAMDQYVGRVVAGLNLQSHEFAVSPPYFVPSMEDEIELSSDMNSVFPFIIATEYRLLVKFCFASLLFGKEFLLQELGSNSPLHSNALFAQCQSHQHLFQQSSTWLVVKFAWEKPEIYLTGIPPHVMLFFNHRSVMNEVVQLHTVLTAKIEAASNDAILAIRADLDSRSIGGGQVSLNRFEAMLAPINECIHNLVENLAMHSAPLTTPTANENGAPSSSAQPTHHMRYQWGKDNKWRRLPEN